MTTSRTKLAAKLKAKFGSPRALLRALGLDENLADVGKPASGGGSTDPLQKMRTDIEGLLGKLGLSEGAVKAVLEVLDQHAPTDRLPDDDRYAERAGELAGNDAGQEAFRALLKKAGLSEDDIDEALRLAAGGNGEAKDRLPLDATRGGFGGYRSEPGRAPGERFAADEHFGAGRIIVGVNYGPARSRDRPITDAARADYDKRFPDAARIAV